MILLILVVVLLVALPVFGIGRMAWRILRDNEEMEPGGSLSRQMFGRTKNGKSE